jgi:hypothetical protein
MTHGAWLNGVRRERASIVCFPKKRRFYHIRSITSSGDSIEAQMTSITGVIPIAMAAPELPDDPRAAGC